MIDIFVINLARQSCSNKNVEVGGRDGFKRFGHGFTAYMRPIRRIDGGWWISIARQLRICVCTNADLLSEETRGTFASAFQLLFKVHHALRYPLFKGKLFEHDQDIKNLLRVMVSICAKNTKSGFNRFKYHLPYHWADARQQLGCSAAEKSLERKLGETHKKYYGFTNGRFDIKVMPFHPTC